MIIHGPLLSSKIPLLLFGNKYTVIHSTNQSHNKMSNLPPLAASMSIILPGVQTMISAPRFNSAICSEIPVPP